MPPPARMPHFAGSASFAFVIDASTVFVIELPEPAPAPLIVNVPLSGIIVGSPEPALIAAAIVIASIVVVDDAMTRTSRFALMVESETRARVLALTMLTPTEMPTAAERLPRRPLR